MRLILAAATAAILSGCMSLSGYDAESKFACKAPDGILCESMTGIYENARQKNLPGQQVNRKGGEGSGAPVELSRAKDSEAVLTKPVYSGTPIRSAPRILRLWFVPWEDSDGDLHDQSYVYLPVDSGRWLVEHNRRRIQDAYRPVRPPAQSALPSAVQAQQQAALSAQAKQRAQRDAQRDAAPSAGEEGIGIAQPRLNIGNPSEFLQGILTPGQAPQQ